MCDTKFYVCKHCGNLVGMIHASGVPIICCGDPMTLLEPNTVDASQEKHVPVVEVDGEKVFVKIGSAVHPMVPEHYIGWIYLQTEQGGQRKRLEIGAAPEACFKVSCGDKPVCAYAWCNLHGLWAKDI